MTPKEVFDNWSAYLRPVDRPDFLEALQSIALSESAQRNAVPQAGSSYTPQGDHRTETETGATPAVAAPSRGDKPQETPRTDALLAAKPGMWRNWKDADFHELERLCKVLERELAELQWEQIEHNTLGCHIAKTGIYAPITPSHEASVGDKMPRTFEYLLNAMEAAAQAYNPHREGYAEKRRAVFQHVEDLWADYIRLLREKQDGLTVSASGELSIAKALLRAHNNERHGHLIKADDYYGAVARALEIVAAESRSKA
jgi:hypothetical protein